MICGKNQVVLIDTDSKRSSSSCFQGHNLHHQVTCFKLYIFLPSMILKDFSNLKGIICTKNRGPFFSSRAYENRASLHGSFIQIQYCVVGIIDLITRFLCAVRDAQCNTEEPPLD